MTINKLLEPFHPNSINYQPFRDLDVRTLPAFKGPDDALRGQITEFYVTDNLRRAGAIPYTDIPRTLDSGLELKMTDKGPGLFNLEGRPLSEYDGLFSYNGTKIATQVKARGLKGIRKQLQREVD